MCWAGCQRMLALLNGGHGKKRIIEADILPGKSLIL